MKTIRYKELGNKIRQYRKKAHLTQEELADLIGLSQKYISNIECAKAAPSLPTLINLCNVLKATPNQLLLDSIEFKDSEFNRDIAGLLEDCTQSQMKEILGFIDYVKNK